MTPTPNHADGVSTNEPSDLAAPLAGILVVSIEQAVSAPYASSRLAEAGARVIKVERPPAGDFARDYDAVVHGESAHFVWLNQGKESVVLDFNKAADNDLLQGILRRADIFIHNLSPGAIERAGFGDDVLRRQNSRLITCAISGYGEDNEYSQMRAYDNVVQAESGLFAVTGNAAGPARVGISLCDISAGAHAYMAILEALIERNLTGRGRRIALSLFECIADWMTVHLLFQKYTGRVSAPMGLAHPSIAPYGAYESGDGRKLMIAVQNDGEWGRFCASVLRQSEYANDARFATNPDRVKHRAALDEVIRKVLSSLEMPELVARLKTAQIAHGMIRTIAEVLEHPALHTSEIDTPTGPVTLPRRATPRTSLAERKSIPALGADTEKIRREFAFGG